MKTTSILATFCGLSLLLAAEAKGAEGTTTTAARAYTGDVEPQDETDLHRESRRSEIPHNGFTVDVRGGAVGCTGQICKSGQSASPGGQVAGFLGGNIRGWVDIGLQGSWGALRPDVADTSVLDIYGIDASAVEEELAAVTGSATDMSGLTVSSGKVNMASVGPALRLHFVPRGRMLAYVGSGIGYQLYRSRYVTALGDAELSFHGLGVPVQAGLGVHVVRHFAFVAEFDYTWTRYIVANVDTPVESMVAPMSLLQNVTDVDLQSRLPKFWGVTFGARARF
jgi:hypothetical protein